MPTVWFSLKKSLHCKTEATDVHDPKITRKQHLNTILTRKGGRSGCSRSIANLKDVIHGGSKRHLERPPSTCSPRSIGSSEFLNPIAHEVILSNSTCELKITGYGGFQEGSGAATGGGGGGGGGGNDASGGSTFMGTLRPGTPGPGGHPTMHFFNHAHRKTASSLSGGCPIASKPMVSVEKDSDGSCVSVSCHKCGEQFGKWEVLEAHHLSKHAVTELVEGDSSRKIVEIICRSSWLKSESQCGRIERVLKVHNMQKTLARFEEHREMVKNKASKLPKKHPRCIADGNELLRFHGTTVACSLGINGSSSLCISEKCCVCRILRNGFSTKHEFEGGVGVFTTSTSARAFESIMVKEGDSSVKRALIVCRVIAGRVHRPLEDIREIAGQTGFDSLAGKVGLYSNIEELYLLNSRSLLPCFVVICKP
ncbi:C2H2 zinc finger transcription factor [Lithospermum erythrorhizon]|uniref:C2H2 zinc finger transcription factor n=1 Tax=Lithospermum erythrorhizon TaxID=34254 RepID=A0AAV3NZI6_LITER